VDDQMTAETKPHEEPLFVLQYQEYKTILPRIGITLVALLFGFAALAAPSRGNVDLIIKFFAAACFLLVGTLALDALLFREIRLYEDRIVRIWELIGATEIKLAEAKVVIRCVGALGLSSKSIVHSGSNVHWGWLADAFRFTAIHYHEHFAHPDDVRKMNSLLAELSGRKIEEFERSTTMQRLMKEHI